MAASLYPPTFDYADLMLCCNDTEQSTSRNLIAALGPEGPGLVAITGLPGLADLRRRLLPLARTLALMPSSQRHQLLKGSGLGTDVPMKKADRPVSSFASQLKFDKDAAFGVHNDGSPMLELGVQEVNEAEQIGELFKTLGLLFVKTGLLVAHVCDAAHPHIGLEKEILNAGTAKGRLIHYHSLNERALSSVSKKGVAPKFELKNDAWQQWHYDYGIFTVVMEPLFQSSSGTLSCDGKLKLPSDESCLHVMDAAKGSTSSVFFPSNSVIVQVGEAAQVLSGGKMQATLHCVLQPTEHPDISRETFVVFLQPAWDRILVPPEGCSEASIYPCSLSLKKSTTEETTENQDYVKIDSVLQSIYLDDNEQKNSKVVPPLSSRWKSGSTFAEFAKITTQLYYGSDGIQSKR